MFLGAGVVLGLTWATLISVLRDSESLDMAAAVVSKRNAVYGAVLLKSQKQYVKSVVNDNMYV